MSGNRATRDNRDLHRIVPSQVSNRRLFKQMELWGFRSAKRHGNTIEMKHPTTGVSVYVMSPDMNKGNDTFMIRACYDAACGGDAIGFWSRTTPVRTELTNVTHIKPRPAESQARPTRPRYEVSDSVPTPTATTTEETHDVTTTPPETPVTGDHTPDRTPEPPTVPPNPGNGRRGLSADVLAYMERRGRNATVTITDVVNEFKIDRTQASNALIYLNQKGHVERIMNGSYRLIARLAATETIHHAHTGPVEHVPHPPAVPDLPRAWSDNTTPLNVQVDPVRPPDEDHLDTLLELVLPDGYRFKARHLDAMAAWKRATAELLITLQS